MISTATATLCNPLLMAYFAWTFALHDKSFDIFAYVPFDSKPPRLLDLLLHGRRVPVAGGRRKSGTHFLEEHYDCGLDHGGRLRFFLKASNATPPSPFRYILRCCDLIISKLAATHGLLSAPHPPHALRRHSWLWTRRERRTSSTVRARAQRRSGEPRRAARGAPATDRSLVDG